MPKKPSRTALIEWLMRADAIPAHAEASPKGDASWSRDGLSLRFGIERKPNDLFGWYVEVGDEKLGPLMKGYGGMAVIVRTIGNPSLQWPGKLDAESTGRLSGEIKEAGSFVANRADLAMIFTSDSDISRGALYVWLPRANLVARLVQGLILARDIGDTRVENEVLGKLRSGARVPSYDRDVDILVSAKEWARKYSRALGRKVEL